MIQSLVSGRKRFRKNDPEERQMKRWTALAAALLLILAMGTSALALKTNADGLYVDNSGNVINESDSDWGTHMPGYYIGNGVAYPISGDNDYSSGTTAPTSSSDGGMTVTSSDGSQNSLPEGAVINLDGSLTIESGTLGTGEPDSQSSGHLTEEEWAARLAKARAKLGVTTGIAYVDDNGVSHPAEIETLGLGRSTVLVDGTRMLVPTSMLVWDTEASEDKRLAVVSTGKLTYATLRAKKSRKAFVMGHCEKCRVLLVIKTGKTWTMVDDHGVRGYVLTSTLSFYDNKPKQYASGMITIKGRAVSDATVHVRSSRQNTARQIAEFPVGTLVTVFSQEGKWSEIDVGGWHCYILSEFLTLQEPLLSAGAETGGEN